jgi:hypothetical protein
MENLRVKLRLKDGWAGLIVLNGMLIKVKRRVRTEWNPLPLSGRKIK